MHWSACKNKWTTVNLEFVFSQRQQNKFIYYKQNYRDSKHISLKIVIYVTCTMHATHHMYCVTLTIEPTIVKGHHCLLCYLLFKKLHTHTVHTYIILHMHAQCNVKSCMHLYVHPCTGTVCTFLPVQVCSTTYVQELSSSTVVLNSRDWSEIVWLPEFRALKINLAIGFIRKNPLGCIC